MRLVYCLLVVHCLVMKGTTDIIGISYNEDYMKTMYKEQQKQMINPAETGKGFGIKNI